MDCTEEKFYPLSTSGEALKSPYEQYPVTICGQTIILTNGELAAAIIDDEIVGMAGASADSPSFWQIGVNVNKNFEGRHIATGLVSMLKADILKKEIVPYYGTSFSNLASQHVAAKAGFEVAWVELITERIEC